MNNANNNPAAETAARVRAQLANAAYVHGPADDGTFSVFTWRNCVVEIRKTIVRRVPGAVITETAKTEGNRRRVTFRVENA